jgi:hypothetical protein
MGLSLIIFPQAKAIIPGYQSAMAQIKQVHQARHGVSKFCQYATPNENIDMLGFAVEKRLSLDTAQTASLKQVTDSLKARSADFQAICANVGVNVAAPDKLAQVETAMITGLETLQEIQVPFSAFYGSLSPEQQTILNEALSDH